MKRILLTLLAALFLFSACVSDEPEESGTTQSGTAETELPPDPVSLGYLEDFTKIAPSGEHLVRVLFLNVGKADAILVEVDSAFWLIDTGSAVSLPMVFAGLHTLGVTKLNGIFITHTDNDHIGGLAAVTENIPADAVYTSFLTTDYDKVERLRGDVPRSQLKPGAVVEAGEGVWFEVLGPYVYNSRDDNNSLVLRLRVNGTSILFTGDMMDEEEFSLIDAGLDLDCDLLKVGHHGKKDATSAQFLAAATPAYSVISANREEESDSAHKSVIKALQNTGEVWITEDVSLGVMAEIFPDGAITLREQTPLEDAAEVRFVSVSKSKQLVTLENAGEEDVDLGGWWIVSETGKELFLFPEDTVIAAGDVLTVGCVGSGGEGDLIWNDSKVWNKSKEDNALLYDLYGNVIDEMMSE